MNSAGKKGVQFLHIPIIYRRAKNQRKLLSHFWEKRQTDGITDGQTDVQWWFYRTLLRTGVSLSTLSCISWIFRVLLYLNPDNVHLYTWYPRGNKIHSESTKPRGSKLHKRCSKPMQCHCFQSWNKRNAVTFVGFYGFN